MHVIEHDIYTVYIDAGRVLQSFCYLLRLYFGASLISLSILQMLA